MSWFWKRKEQPKPMCFLIEEDLMALSATDSYVMLDIEKAISDTGKGTLANGCLDMRHPETIQTIWVYPFRETPDLTPEEVIASLAKYGFHATLIEGDVESAPRRPFGITVYIPWITWSKHHKEDE
jgi:hypothetical protein